MPLNIFCEIKISSTNFVYFKSSMVNVRSGPGKIYPVKWVYQVKGMPMQVLDKFDNWFYIRDIDGDVGWVFHAMVVEKYFKALTIRNGEIRKNYSKKSKVIAKVERLSLVNIKKCSVDFCLIEVSNIRGWIDKDILWGLHYHFQ
ncbi:hypothetical protein CAXC1_20019 [Candidatus Xenohaliotis californiensis]|uniref:SH3b domain-containing protein n=2 Tax=Candidatus Xenohaliotis californiensis TaxID=84677 RepID=A0ABP0ESV2_9RICK|nr:hypothetical protein CAXC1_20019 [Candidatus Xenohaliotis californiensis]